MWKKWKEFRKLEKVISWKIQEHLDGQKERTGNSQKNKTKRPLTLYGACPDCSSGKCKLQQQLVYLSD